MIQLGRALVLTLLAILAVGGCSRSDARSPGPLRVVVTVPPLAGLVKPLLPPDASIVALMAPGRSEHGYEFSPADLAKLGAADVVVYVGLGLEPSVESFLKRNPKSSRREVCFATIAGIADTHDHEHHDHHDHHDHTHAVDPHLWFDVDLCIKLVDAVAEAVTSSAALAGVSGWSNADSAEDQRARLRQLDAECREQLLPVRGQAIVTHHNAWQRLADRYGLRVAAVIREIDGEPTPGAIAAAVDAIRKQGARGVFVEPQFDPAAAQRIADTAGVRLGVLDPLGDGDYFAMMRNNVNALVTTLKD